jgi:TonB family protein
MASSAEDFSFARTLEARLKRYWSAPDDLVWKNLVLEFQIEQNGCVTEIKTIRSSGLQSVDKSAIAAVEQACPLKTPPGSGPVRVCFNASPSGPNLFVSLINTAFCDPPADPLARAHSVRSLEMAKTIENELKQIIVQAEASLKCKDWKKAEEQLVLASTKDPSNKTVLHELALVYEHESMIGQAVICERKALRLDENFVEAQQELAHLYRLIGARTNSAEEHPKIVRKINPDNIGEATKITY